MTINQYAPPPLLSTGLDMILLWRNVPHGAFTWQVLSRVRAWGPFHKKILRLRYTLGTSSSSWRNTISAFLCQQTIVTPTSSHSKSLCTFEKLVIIRLWLFVKRIFALDIGLRLRSILRFFVKRGPGRAFTRRTVL